MMYGVLCVFVFVCLLFVFVRFVCDVLCVVVGRVLFRVTCGFVCCVLLLIEYV